MRRPLYVLVFLFGAIVVGAAGLLYWADRRDGSLPAMAGAGGQGAEQQVAAADEAADAPSTGLPGNGTEPGTGDTSDTADSAAQLDREAASDADIAVAEPTPGPADQGPDADSQASEDMADLVPPDGETIADEPVAGEVGSTEPAPAAEAEETDPAGDIEGSQAPQRAAEADEVAAEDVPSATDGLAIVEDLGTGEPEDGETEPDEADNSSGPTFDVVRVEPNGEALMAGRAEPNSDIEILADDEVIARVTADADGAFLVIPDEPLDSGSHNVTVRQAGTDEEAGPDQQVAVIIPGDIGDVAAEEPSESAEPDEQIAALEQDPAGLGPAGAEPSDNAPAGPVEEPADQAAMSAEPDSIEEDVSETPAAEVIEQAAVLPEPAQELETVPETGPASPAETGIAEPSDGAPALPELGVTGEQDVATASPDETGAREPDTDTAEAIVPINPWDAELAAVPPGLAVPATSSETEDVREADIAMAQPGGDTATADAEIAAAEPPADEPGIAPAGEQDIAIFESSETDQAIDRSDAEESPEEAERRIQLGEADATANGSAAPGSEIGTLDGPTEDAPAVEQAVAAVDDAAAGDEPAPEAEPEGLRSAAAPEPQRKLVIRAAEAEAQTLYVAGEAAPGTMVRVYADEDFVGAAEAGDGGNWLLEVRRAVPAGEVTIRADAVEAGTLNAVDQAELPFVRYSDGVVLEPVATAAGGEIPATITADLPAPTFVIIRRGDNLWRISRRNYGRGIRYHAIFDANRDRIRNPHLIYPGQVFVVPTRDLTWETATN